MRQVVNPKTENKNILFEVAFLSQVWYTDSRRGKQKKKGSPPRPSAGVRQPAAPRAASGRPFGGGLSPSPFRDYFASCVFSKVPFA